MSNPAPPSTTNKPPYEKRVVKFNTNRYTRVSSLVFNREMATNEELNLLLQLLEAHLDKKAKGKTDVQLNTRGLYHDMQLLLLERPNWQEEKHLMIKTGRALGLAISRLLHRENGYAVHDYVGKWRLMDYKSNIQGRVYFMRRFHEDNDEAGQTVWDSITDSKEDSTGPLRWRTEEEAESILRRGLINTRAYEFSFRYPGSDGFMMCKVRNRIETEELGGEQMAGQFNTEKPAEESTNNTLENLL